MTTSFRNCPHSTRTAGHFTDPATKKHQNYRSPVLIYNLRVNGHSSSSQTTATQIKLSCLLQLTTSPTLYQQTSSMETALSLLHQINLLNSTHCTQWSTISCTHSSFDYYSVKVKKYTTITSTDPKPLFNNINIS